MSESAVSRPPLGAGHTATSVTERISSIVLERTPRWWYLAFGVAFALTVLLFYGLAVLLARGVGIFGLDMPVAWGFPIVNFVWWIGIGHAGTLISAILLLLRQQWRTSINRFAEAMTIFAVACAALYPLIHLGRPWLFYWIIPYPNSKAMWPQFRSPLVWDFFAIGTYALTSILFWYVGLIPDLATMRDRARNRLVKKIYGFFAMGWRGAASHWQNYETAYLLLAGLATPLVISVHSVVSLDFASGQLPGWHSTIFPPYFVAGAVYAGFAMVITLAVPLRALFRVDDFITERHLDNMAKILLTTGLIVAYGYGMELFMAWYSGNPIEQFTLLNRITGPYRFQWYALILCNVAVPQLLWLRRIRVQPLLLWIVAGFVNVGMWLERYVIVITSLHRDFIPASWGMFHATRWDWALFAGTLGLFLALLFLFIRFLPLISIFEMRTLVPSPASEDET